MLRLIGILRPVLVIARGGASLDAQQTAQRERCPIDELRIAHRDPFRRVEETVDEHVVGDDVGEATEPGATGFGDGIDTGADVPVGDVVQLRPRLIEGAYPPRPAREIELHARIAHRIEFPIEIRDRLRPQ